MSPQLGPSTFFLSRFLILSFLSLFFLTFSMCHQHSKNLKVSSPIERERHNKRVGEATVASHRAFISSGGRTARGNKITTNEKNI